MVEKNANADANYSQELVKLKPRFDGLVQVARVLKVIDEETKKQAIDYIRELNVLTEKFQSTYDYFIKPFEDHVKKVKKDFRPFFKEIESIVGKDSYAGLRGQLSDYETKMQEIRDKEEARLRAEQQKAYDKKVEKADKKGEIAPPPPPPVLVQAKKEEGVSYSDKWTYHEDRVEIEKVPEVFGGVRLKVLDGKATQKLIEAGCREIPGIPIYCKKTPIIREEKLENL